MRKRTSIIIPTFNGLRLLQNCIRSIQKHTDPHVTPYELIIVDNGSSDGTQQWCKGSRLRFIALPYNMGFPAACNKGLRLASGDSLLLLNNDVMVTDNWLCNLLSALYSDSSIGMVGPVTNFASGKQQVHYPFHNIEEFLRIAREVNRPDPGKWEATERLIGFCLLFRRELYEQIGELDEQFSPGHYEDDDYCFRTRMHGLRLLICRDVLVYHEGSASFRQKNEQEVRQLVERNRQKFIQKWNVDPALYF